MAMPTSARRAPIPYIQRQPLPVFDRSRYAGAAGLARGAYVMADAGRGQPQVILIASGSEVQLCVEAYESLAAAGVGARVVSMPSWELFEQQDEAYRESVLPADIPAIALACRARAAGRHAGVLAMTSRVVLGALARAAGDRQAAHDRRDHHVTLHRRLHFENSFLMIPMIRARL